jgi:sphingolipid delta-4 desaturase
VRSWLLQRCVHKSLSDFSMFGGAESLKEGKEVPNRSTRRTEVVRPNGNTDALYGPPQDPNDFLWLMTEEPHRSRRKEIISAHPEVRLSFCLHDPLGRGGAVY